MARCEAIQASRPSTALELLETLLNRNQLSPENYDQLLELLEPKTTKAREEDARLAVRKWIPTRPQFLRTYGALPTLRLPVLYCRASSAAISGLPINLSPTPARFCYPDPSLIGEILLRFRTFIAGRENVECPAIASHLWNRVLDWNDIATYKDEGWVREFCSRIFSVVEELLVPELERHALAQLEAGKLIPQLPPTKRRFYVHGEAPALKWSVQGDTTLTAGGSHPGLPQRKSAVPTELITDLALTSHLETFGTGPQDIGLEGLKGGEAILSKLDLHGQSVVQDADCGVFGTPEWRYSMVFSGSKVLLTQTVWHQGVKGLRHSQLLDVAGDDAPHSLIALIIGMILPADIVAYPADPRQPDFEYLPGLKAAVEAVRGSDGDEGRGRSNESRADETAAGSKKRKRAAETSAGAAAVLEDEAEVTLRYPTPESSAPSTSTSGVVLSPLRGLLLVAAVLDGIYHHELGALLRTRRKDKNPSICIDLLHSIASGYKEAVWKGVVRGPGGGAVVTKRFDRARFEEMHSELRALVAVASLGPRVARCTAVIAPDDVHWIVIVMEDAGSQLGTWEDWNTAPLTDEDRESIYSTLCQMHELGVTHGDVEPRNIVRRPSGELACVDFGRASQDHFCPGSSCVELQDLPALALPP